MKTLTVPRARMEQAIERSVAERVTTRDFDRLRLELMAFGMVPPGFDLEATLVAMEKEQLLGVYQPTEGRILLKEETPRSESEPASAPSLGRNDVQTLTQVHELVHVLQDQHFGIKRLLSPPGLSRDALLARRALLEGDATYVTVQLLLGSATDLSLQLHAGRQGRQALEVSTDPALRALLEAPLVLRDRTLFPYLEGLDFVARLVRERGMAVVDAAYQYPPASTEQVLHPQRYLEGERPHQILWDDERLNEQMGEVAMQGTLGELGIRSLLNSHGQVLEAAGVGWGGDAYRLYQRPDDLTVFWHSSWDQLEGAEGFHKAWLANEQRWVERPTCVLSERRETSVMVVISSGTRACSLLPSLWSFTRVTRPEPSPPPLFDAAARRRKR